MNQSRLDHSLNRHARKRNSYDLIKGGNSLRNPKKSLPEVFIDLNNHSRKGRLTIEDKQKQHSKHAEHKHEEISHFNEGKKTKIKKDNLLLKNMYYTEAITKNEDKNVLNQYRDEIELLKLDNERLREENEKMRTKEKYYHRRLSQLQTEQKNQEAEFYEIQQRLQTKLQEYSHRIRTLYQQLIKAKRGSVRGEHDYPHEPDYREPVVFSTLGSENRHKTKGQIYSYRNRQPSYEIVQNQPDKYKRLTSPSSHSRGKTDKITKWQEQQKENLRRYEQRGQQAYYRIGTATNQDLRDSSGMEDE